VLADTWVYDSMESTSPLRTRSTRRRLAYNICESPTNYDPMLLRREDGLGVLVISTRSPKRP